MLQPRGAGPKVGVVDPSASRTCSFYLRGYMPKPIRLNKVAPKPIARFVKRLEEQCNFDRSKHGDGNRGSFDFSTQASILHTTLQCAVPLWVHKWLDLEKRLPFDMVNDRMSRRAKECADYVAEHGDALMFRVKGISAEAFNRIAEGIAIASFSPGGIKAFGSRWETKRMRVEA